MFERILIFLRGNLIIDLYGKGRDRALNLCGNQGILLRNLHAEGEQYRFELTLPEFRKALPLFRKTGALFHIRRKKGMPFLIDRNRQRSVYFGALLFSFLLLLIQSQLLFHISIQGNHQYTDGQLQETLFQEGIHYGMFMGNITCEPLEQKIRLEYPNITWVSVQKNGCFLKISLKEEYGSNSPDLSVNPPCDLAASSDGRIVSIVTRCGTPLVKPGDSVTAGQVLVSGQIPLINDSGDVIGQEQVRADADIRALVSYPFQFEQEIKRTEKSRVRVFPCRLTVILGNRVWDLGLKRVPEDGNTTDIISYDIPLFLFDQIKLPVCFRISFLQTYENKMVSVTEEEFQRSKSLEIQNLLRQLEAFEPEIQFTDIEDRKNSFYRLSQGRIWLVQNFGEAVSIPGMY